MSERIDGVLPHGYGWKKTAEQEEKDLEEAQRRNPGSGITIYDVSVPSEIGEFCIDAAIALNAKNYVIAGDAFWGHKLTSAETSEHAIRSKLPGVSVINAGGARTTSMETDKLVEETERHNWERAATIAVGKHYKRAALNVRRRKDGRFDVYAAEGILLDPQTHGGGEEGERIAAIHKQRFEEIKKSRPYKKLKRHETIAIFIERFYLTRVADFVSRKIRPRVMSK